MSNRLGDYFELSSRTPNNGSPATMITPNFTTFASYRHSVILWAVVDGTHATYPAVQILMHALGGIFTLRRFTHSRQFESYLFIFIDTTFDTYMT